MSILPPFLFCLHLMSIILDDERCDVWAIGKCENPLVNKFWSLLSCYNEMKVVD